MKKVIALPGGYFDSVALDRFHPEQIRPRLFSTDGAT